MRRNYGQSTNLENVYFDSLKQIDFYKYLGVDINPSPVEISNMKEEKMISTVNKFKCAVYTVTKDGPDMTDMALAFWKTKAIPTMLYGIESIIISDSTIDKLETIQASFGKSVLGVRRSTANIFPICDLGLKLIRHKIYEMKIKFFDRLKKLPNFRF